MNRQESLSYILERKERFELSKRVWKTHMFPATSLPPGISDCRFAQFLCRESLPNRNRLDLEQRTNRQSAIENRQCLEPPIGLEPIPNSFEANRSSIKLRGQGKISDCGLRNSEFKFANASENPNAVGNSPRSRQTKFAIRNSKSEICYWSIVPDSNRCLSVGNAVS